MTWSRSWSGKSGEIGNIVKGEMGVPEASREYIKANLPKDETSQFSASAYGHDVLTTDGKQIGASVSVTFSRQDSVPAPEVTNEPKPVETAAEPAGEGNGEMKHAEAEEAKPAEDHSDAA